MDGFKPQKLVKLDGRVGEGGGQLVRIAVSLAALTGTPLRIDHVRGNRGDGKRGGGLKAQHASCVRYLADATAAEVTGCYVGSKSIEFKPTTTLANLVNRNIRIKAESAASILLVFQSMLPFLLFCGDDSGSPITATIQGGTNVRFSLSFEYFDQVLAPALERFGVKIDRKLDSRGWSLGATNVGSATFRFVPLTPGQTLKAPVWPVERGEITEIDITILVPADTIEAFKKALVFRIDQVLPGVGTNYHLVEDSRHRTRIYTLLVAHTSTGLRFGCDWLYDRKATGKTPDDIATEVAEKVVAKLDAEVQKGGLVDEYLQDQLVVFQALAEGSSSIPGNSEALSSEGNQVDRTDEPFGDGSQHTTTARWVTSQLLPHTKWIDKGRICKGAGWKAL